MTTHIRTQKSVLFRPYSLLELLVAMAVLIVIMLCMVTILSSAQGICSNSLGQDNVFSDSRTAFDLITRDLQSSLYQEDKIFFWQESPEKINFISVTGSSDTHGCSVCEIRYKLDSADDFIKRSEISSDTPAKWNFYGNKSVSVWADDTDDFQKITPYVTGLKFTCFRKDGSVIAPDSGALTEYPFSVKIDITVLGRTAYRKWKENNSNLFRKENERIFTKTVYLGSRQ
jgi:hypothetical protein